MTAEQIRDRYWSFNDIDTLDRLAETEPSPEARRAAAAMARRLRRQEDYAASGEWS